MGSYIAIEGIDGCGKSSVINILKTRIFANNDKIVFTREPGGTNISEDIRKIILNPENLDMDPLTEAALFNAARHQTISELVLPALKEDKIVISDRSVYSSVVYQGITRKLGADVIIDINKRIKVPDLVYIISTRPETCFERLQAKGNLDRLDCEGLEFLKQSDKGYSQLTNTILDTPLDTHIVFITGECGSEYAAKIIYENLQEKGIVPHE